MKYLVYRRKIMNPWLFSFLISCALLIALLNWKELSTNIHGGILSAVFKLFEEVLADKYNIFEYSYFGLNLPQWAFFLSGINVFMVGIAFNMGIIIMQFFPVRPGWQLVYVLVWGFFILGFNKMAEDFNLIMFTNFKYFYVIRQLFLFLFLAWFKDHYLSKVGRAAAVRG